MTIYLVEDIKKQTMMMNKQERRPEGPTRLGVWGRKPQSIMRLADPKNWLMAFINKNKPIFSLLEGDKNSL